MPTIGLVRPGVPARRVVYSDFKLWGYCGLFGGSLFASSGYRCSISSRIGSEMASMRLKSRTSLWMRSISAEWMIRPSKTRELVAKCFLDHCGRSCAGCGNGPSCSNT